jgi:hypothetical protein
MPTSHQITKAERLADEKLKTKQNIVVWLTRKQPEPPPHDDNDLLIVVNYGQQRSVA